MPVAGDANESSLIVEGVRNDLMRVIQNEYSSQDAFIVHSDLCNIWSRKRVRSFLTLCCGCPDEHQDAYTSIVTEHYLRIISILVHISWVRWSTFIEIFLGTSTTWNQAREIGRSDEHLPFTSLHELKDETFLGSFGFQFQVNQYFFIPISIGERRFDHHTGYTEDYRLPVLKTEPLGRGASGVVYRETIAPGCIVLQSGGWNSDVR